MKQSAPKVLNSTASPNDRQVGGSHYRDSTGVCPHCHGEVQHWDWGGGLPGLEYAATKYIARHRSKRGKEDLEKAIHYVQKIIERDYPEQMELDLITASDGDIKVHYDFSDLVTEEKGPVGAALYAVLETLDPPVSQPMFLTAEATKFIDSQEYQDAVEAYAARQRADAYAATTHTGPTPWQVRHPEVKG